LEEKRPIYVGTGGRKTKDLDNFYNALGKAKSAKIELSVMDMWKAFEKSTIKNAPQSAILYDKFHIIRHLNKALDTIRKEEYKKLDKDKWKYIKGQKYVLLSKRSNLKLSAKQSLDELLSINKRLNTAYILKESFAQLWDYRSEVWATKFFNNWKKSLRWKRLKPYEKFAKLIERHWDGIVAHCRPENKISFGFVEGLNNKIRVIQRRAFGLKDTKYIQLKILTSMLPKIT